MSQNNRIRVTMNAFKPIGLGAIFCPFLRQVRKLNIKKVDDKPMVIHTKEKAKLHIRQEPEAKIKGRNILVVTGRVLHPLQEQHYIRE